MPLLMKVGSLGAGPPLLVTQQEQTVFAPEGQPPDTMNVLTPPRLMGLGVTMGGPPILVTQANYSPIEAIKAVDTPITHPLVKFRLARGGKIGPPLLTQQAQPQAGPRTFVVSSPIPGGTLTTAATLVRALSTRVSGALTTTGALIRSMTQAISGTLTTAGVLKRGAQIVRGGVLATAAAIGRAVSAKISGVLTPTSVLAGGKLLQRSISGSLSVAGALSTKEIDKPVTLPRPIFTRPSDTTGADITDMPWDGITHGKGEVNTR